MMDNMIYWFSGRGNSLSVTRGLEERLENSASMPIASVSGQVALPSGSVGLVFPIIDLGIPACVRRFVKRLQAAGKTPYLYAIITCGGMPGSTAQMLKRLLRRQGLALNACWTIKFGLERKTDEEWRAMLDEIAGAVRERLERAPVQPAWKDRLLSELANPLARLIIPAEDKKFLVGNECNGCGTCAKVCPVGNIEIKDGRPVWLHRCEQCAACFSWCPNAAISGSCLAARTHYTNPQTHLEQMLVRGARG